MHLSHFIGCVLKSLHGWFKYWFLRLDVEIDHFCDMRDLWISNVLKWLMKLHFCDHGNQMVEPQDFEFIILVFSSFCLWDTDFRRRLLKRVSDFSRDHLQNRKLNKFKLLQKKAKKLIFYSFFIETSCKTWDVFLLHPSPQISLLLFLRIT